jgi:septum formation topological specificity factor MinE
MKILITESQELQLIGESIKDNFPQVIAISFKEKGVMLGDSMKMIKRKVIDVITDYHNVLEGNTNVSQIGDTKLNKEIRSFVEKYFSIDFNKYGSEYEINFYVLGTLKSSY